MVDGHVESFHFNAAICNPWLTAGSGTPVPTCTKLLRKNIHVDAPLPQY
jgi:hypothetical protein